jgi:hypothetical protein
MHHALAMMMMMMMMGIDRDVIVNCQWDDALASGWVLCIVVQHLEHDIVRMIFGMVVG